MGKKKRTQLFVLKPWCWYCEREFEDEKVLLQHQKSKHFKCQLCPRKLNTAGGLMVHSQQVHKCEPEPLTNTLPGRDGYDIEIFGMEGVPTNALAEWKARKESEAGSAAMAAAVAGARPRHVYGVIPEADLQAALVQHKILMARRHVSATKTAFPSFPPSMPPGFIPGALPPGFPPGFAPPPAFAPPFAQTMTLPAQPNTTPLPPGISLPVPSVPPVTSTATMQPLDKADPAVDILPPKDGVMWPDATASPAEKRSQQARYRYVSPGPEAVTVAGTKRKAAADFL